MRILSLSMLSGILFAFPLTFAACGSPINQAQIQYTTTVNPSFQTQISPLPTVPLYRCGAWTSTNAPGAYSAISIYAKLTKANAGVEGAKAKAIIHFRDSDMTMNQEPVSDKGGYVTFSLPLQGRQPRLVPATITVTFTIHGTTVPCSQAFFTPQ